MSFFWAYADTYSPLLPIVMYLILRNKVPKHFTCLFWYLVSCTLLFGWSNILADKGLNNPFIYHLFALVEMSLLSLFFFRILQSKRFLRFLVIAYIGYVVFFIVNVLFLEKLTDINGNTISAEFLLLIIFCFFYFFEIINSKSILTFERDGNFWVVSGLLTYCTGSLMSFAFYKYFPVSQRHFLFEFWKLQIILYILKNISITAGILCFRKK